MDDERVTDRRPPPPPAVDPAEVIAAIQEHFERLRLPSWPVFGLANSDTPGWLYGAGEDQHGVQVVRLDYRPPFQPERLIVQTHHDERPAPSLRTRLDQLNDAEDDGEPLGLFGEEPATA